MQLYSAICLLSLASGFAWQHDDNAAPHGVHNFGIYGGQPVNITEVPFMALFRPRATDWHCGASIINKKFLITAGHCSSEFASNNLGAMRITVGTDSVEGGTDYEIEKIARHPKFVINDVKLDYDLAVIKLKKELELNDRVAPIAIADSSLPKTGEMLQIYGFGDTENGNNPSKILLKLDVPAVDKQTCIKRVNNSLVVITERMICAGGKEAQSACNGDSGGPLIYKGKLIGAVSCGFTQHCAEGVPDGYAYIPSMMDFVNEIIEHEF